MEKCFSFNGFFVLTFLLSAATANICETCLPVSKCTFFKSLARKEQQSWTQKYPCTNNHPDDYGLPPGSKDKVEVVCCPTQVWGLEKSNMSSRLTDASYFGADKYYNDNNYRQYANTNNENDRYTISHDQPWNKQRNSVLEPKKWSYTISDNQQSSNQRKSVLEPKKWSTTNKNTYWNDRDKNQWNVGNQNDYQGNTNNNWRENNQRTPEAKPNQPDGSNNSGSGRSPYFYNWRNFVNDTIRDRDIYQVPRQPDNSKYQPPRQPDNSRTQAPGNSFNRAGQCDSLTRFPPNPQTGCCGREASDGDRINGTPFKINSANELQTKLTKTIDAQVHQTLAITLHQLSANGQRNRCLRSFDPSYIKFNKEVNKADGRTQNNTRTVHNNSTILTSLYSTENVTNVTNVMVEIENRISGGKETELTQYPWTVLLIATFESGTQSNSISCGGSLISSRYVLTAAHCLNNDKATLKSVVVYLSEYDKKTFPRDCKTTSQGRKCIENFILFAENVFLYPSFEESRLRNDIALIKLQTNVPYTDFIRPICLPSINIDNPEHARLTLTAAGWGRDGPYQTDVKQSTVIHLVPQHDCRKFYPDLTPRHLCAAGYSGEDTCKGDSGGPLMVLYQGKYFVVGVVSGKREDVNCGSSVPSLYTNVYHYLDWIRTTIANN